MGTLDEKRWAAAMERIARMKEELELLEEEVRSLAGPAETEDTPAPAETETPAAPVEPVVEPVTEPVPEDLPEEGPEAAQEAVPEDLPETVPEDIPEEPIDLSISDIEIDAAPIEPAPEPAAEPAAEAAEPLDIIDAVGTVEVAPPGKAILDTDVAEKAVMDVMAERQAWRIDRPGTPVKNIISAISLNDRVLLINTLFNEDPLLFQDSIAAFNGMERLEDAVSYIGEHFPDWKLDSEPVYRLMMAVRRKLQ